MGAAFGSLERKVNRRALPVPELMSAELEADSHPANILEEKLRQLVGEIIGRDDVPAGLPLELLGGDQHWLHPSFGADLQAVWHQHSRQEVQGHQSAGGRK